MGRGRRCDPNCLVAVPTSFLTIPATNLPLPRTACPGKRRPQVSAEELGFARPREAQGDFLLGNLVRSGRKRKRTKKNGGGVNFGIF